MKKHWERRSVETRAVPKDDGPTQDGLPRQFWARVVNYGVLDDYGTKFREGFADDYLARRLPRLMYGHAGWDNPNAIVGKGIEWRNVPGEGLDILFEFDDFTYVPTARQLAYQLRNGTLDEFSVGFVRQRDEPDANGQGVWITKARLGEVSIVAEGSVPGTRLLSFRSADPTGVGGMVIDADEVARVISQLYLGELDLAQALAHIKERSVPMHTDATPDEASAEGEADVAPDEPAEAEAEAEALLAELDAALSDAAETVPDLKSRVGDYTQ